MNHTYIAVTALPAGITRATSVCDVTRRIRICRTSAAPLALETIFVVVTVCQPKSVNQQLKMILKSNVFISQHQEANKSVGLPWAHLPSAVSV